jgi:hypothetical protein
MNANEISSKANVRMNRIKTVSRFVKYVFLALFAVSCCFFLYSIRFWASAGWYLLFAIAYGILLCVWYWKLAQLFGFYEHGLIFAAQTTGCIKFLGLLCGVEWALKNIFSILYQLYPAPPMLGPEVTQVHFGFFSFGFGHFEFGFLVAGVVIVLIAWIMDEGRKIQEEQELTV